MKIFRKKTLEDIINRGNAAEILFYVRNHKLADEDQERIAGDLETAKAYLENHEFTSKKASQRYAVAQIMASGRHEEVMAYIRNAVQVPEFVKTWVIQRGKTKEIIALISCNVHFTDIQQEQIINRQVKDEIAELMDTDHLGPRAQQALINRHEPDEVYQLVEHQALDDDSQLLLINNNWREAIQRALKFHSFDKEAERELQIRGMWEEYRLHLQKRQTER